MGELEGKVAFLTGAGSGVGVGIAMALGKAGASIGLMGRTRETLERTKGMLDELGAKSLVCVGDCTVRDDVNRAVAATAKEFGPIWALVNNAYQAWRTPVEEITDEVLDLSLRGCIHNSLYCMQAVFPTMKERGGRIINFGSGGSTQGLPDLGAYNIAKEGIRGLTKTAAMGWGQYGITVNNVCPLAFSDSYKYWFDEMIDDEGRRKHLEGIPMRRVGDPEKDIAPLVVFLASEASGYITSRTFHVDGGNCYYDR
jgi:NAD(P)-dependent dehydrogenase (short-subunit alcohol dehydrogenase family)